MARPAYLDWPFFEPRHRALARELDAWAAQQHAARARADVDAECRALVRSLGDAGWLRHAVGGAATAAPPRRSTRARSA